MAAIRTTIYLEDKDRRSLKVIQDRYGLVTLSDAIRFSVRVVQRLAPQGATLLQVRKLCALAQHRRLQQYRLW